MSDSNWSKRTKARLTSFAAVFGFAIAASVIQLGLSQKAKYEREADDTYKEYASHTYYPQRYACLNPTVFNQIDCIAKHKADAREYERGEQDLVSQRVTALWTAIMGCAAVIGMMLSAVGVFLIWTTFKATQNAVSAANHGNLVTLISARAWLNITVDFAQNGSEQFAIKNVGKSVASNVVSHSCIVGYSSDESLSAGITNTVEGMKNRYNLALRSALFPDEIVYLEIPTREERESIAKAAKNHGQNVYVVIAIHYSIEGDDVQRFTAKAFKIQDAPVMLEEISTARKAS